jgi:hypothetical protein
MMTKKQFKKMSSGGLFARRNNGLIWYMDAYLDCYHAQSQAGHHSQERLEQLVKTASMLAEICHFYLDKLKQKNRSSPRENGVRVLWADATAEAKQLLSRIQAGKSGRQKLQQGIHKIFDRGGAKPHANLKALSQGYWLEAMDPAHRVGHNLKTPFEKWQASGAKQDFFVWLDKLYIPICKLEMDALNTERVLYLDTEEKRQAYEIKINGGNFTWANAGDPFRTNDMHTVFSGDGVAIYVLSADDKFYSANHEKGQFHHSSFLGGKPVVCAGEWAVEDGRGLVMVSPKTGHYLAGEPEFRRLLFVLHRSGVDLQNVVALWPWPRFQVSHWYNAAELLRADDLESMKQPWNNGSPLSEIAPPIIPQPTAVGPNPYSHTPSNTP